MAVLSVAGPAVRTAPDRLHTDDRLDPEKATRAAARHLRDLYHQFGDWYLAIAAYNCGPGCVEKAVERTGLCRFLGSARRNAIPRETTNYVPIILAMTIMAKNPSAYGLENIASRRPSSTTPSSSAPTHLALVADLVERPVSELRELNPALLRNVAPGGYELKVPPGTQAQLASGLEAVPLERRNSWRVHMVSGGETMASIARQYRVPLASLSASQFPERMLGGRTAGCPHGTGAGEDGEEEGHDPATGARPVGPGQDDATPQGRRPARRIAVEAAIQINP